MLFGILLICIIGVYLLCLKPGRKRKGLMKSFESVYIAHRGLFDNSTDTPENSMPAFRKAVELGYGIELDVQLTLDKKMVVFHDYTLMRMCGLNKRVALCTFRELQNYTLKNSEEKIPLFSDVLKEVNGKSPIIVEIKAEENCMETTRMAAKILADYKGEYCIESFHPGAVAWYRKHVPEVPRGQLSSDFMRDGTKRPLPMKWVLSNLLLNGIAKPDFIAYNVKYKDQFSFRLCRALFHPVNAAWTIRSQEQLDQAKELFDIMIFDSFIPDHVLENDEGTKSIDKIQSVL